MREEILHLHDAVYTDSGDPLTERKTFAGFVDHWAGREGFACSTARVEG